jgi:hypothetical protein
LQDAIAERDAGQIYALCADTIWTSNRLVGEYLNDKEDGIPTGTCRSCTSAPEEGQRRDYQQQLEEIALEKQRQIEEAQIWYQRETRLAYLASTASGKIAATEQIRI